MSHFVNIACSNYCQCLSLGWMGIRGPLWMKYWGNDQLEIGSFGYPLV